MTKQQGQEQKKHTKGNETNQEFYVGRIYS